MQIVKITIGADRVLSESLSDFLVGVLNCVVEYTVEDEHSSCELHAFLIQEHYLPSEREELAAQIKTFSDEMAEVFQVEYPTVTTELVEDQDWSAAWKAYFKPFAIRDDLIIAPRWEPYQPGAGEQVIVMDPGMAFGTGHHGTTKLCLELLSSEREQLVGSPVLDVGTGTGILAMAAALWGADPVVGIDNDEEAVSAARKNVADNELSAHVLISGSSLTEIDQRFSVVVANIIHDVLIELSAPLSSVTSVGGVLILSGILRGDQTANIIQCFENLGFSLSERVYDSEWAAIKLRKQG